MDKSVAIGIALALTFSWGFVVGWMSNLRGSANPQPPKPSEVRS